MHKEIILKDGSTALLRSPRIEDAEELIAFMKSVDSETRFLAREPGEFKFNIEQEENFIRSVLKNENIAFIVAEYKGKIVGNCSVGKPQVSSRYEHRAAMGLSILKAYWQLGIGRALIESAMKWCQTSSIEQLELEVVVENKRALQLYQSLGFEILGIKKHALKYSDGSYADEYFMVKFFEHRG